jgi:hypothetical protein
MATTTTKEQAMIITTQNTTFHGKQGERFAFVEEFTIREVTDGFDIYREWDGDEVRVSCTDTVDEAIIYVNQMLGNVI